MHIDTYKHIYIAPFPIQPSMLEIVFRKLHPLASTCTVAELNPVPHWEIRQQPTEHLLLLGENERYEDRMLTDRSHSPLIPADKTYQWHGTK